jgi:uncharacterized protein YecT (DUF1311 family)
VSRRASLALGAAILAAVATACNAGAGEQPRPDDLKTLTACLGTNKDTTARRRCVDLVAAPCLARPDGQSTLGMETCYGRERLAWDQILNRVYGTAQAAFDAAGKAYLRDGQTLWIRYRDQSCQWPAKVYAGGSIVGPLSEACLRDETATRTITLMEIEESLKQH